MSWEEIARRLDAAYKRYRFDKQQCTYCSECHKVPQDWKLKLQNQHAQVGTDYPQSEPKIVFVGLEGLSGVTEVEPPSSTAYNPHFKGVRFVAEYILNSVSDKPVPVNALKGSLKAVQSDEYTDRIALVNMYKCAFNNSRNNAKGLYHSEGMKKNCQKILLDEIEILKPDVLVIQIKSGIPDGFIEAFEERFGKSEEIVEHGWTSAYNHNDMIVVWTYHGSADPTPESWSWANDRQARYINKDLIPVLSRVAERIKEQKTEK